MLKKVINIIKKALNFFLPHRPSENTAAVDSQEER